MPLWAKNNLLSEESLDDAATHDTSFQSFNSESVFLGCPSDQDRPSNGGLPSDGLGDGDVVAGGL